MGRRPTHKSATNFCAPPPVREFPPGLATNSDFDPTEHGAPWPKDRARATAFHPRRESRIMADFTFLIHNHAACAFRLSVTG
ncbi:hypothetical protein T492DRAFT_1101246 [Pavlovales sp. CCMP2436]|nr:hypothetical protein T492DRAFT_1101246 [Pavlovales sp. CCMP2436]